MDKAFNYESGDSRFNSWQGEQFFNLNFVFNNFLYWRITVDVYFILLLLFSNGFQILAGSLILSFLFLKFLYCSLSVGFIFLDFNGCQFSQKRLSAQ